MSRVCYSFCIVCFIKFVFEFNVIAINCVFSLTVTAFSRLLLNKHDCECERKVCHRFSCIMTRNLWPIQPMANALLPTFILINTLMYIAHGIPSLIACLNFTKQSVPRERALAFSFILAFLFHASSYLNLWFFSRCSTKLHVILLRWFLDTESTLLFSQRFNDFHDNVKYYHYLNIQLYFLLLMNFILCCHFEYFKCFFCTNVPNNAKAGWDFGSRQTLASNIQIIDSHFLSYLTSNVMRYHTFR